MKKPLMGVSEGAWSFNAEAEDRKVFLTVATSTGSTEIALHSDEALCLARAILVEMSDFAIDG
ncbi:hypothetical protein Hden_1214 [Hyphomicrobium denitrificans ATCC 51888]|uniref:Uncharacterized protein n=1 Tax=Hyphomicrobium denitrificans (strain ATCC 51888 / DSM 1869 / NCIMB 11706 / TK 0415) TaxID=582899 RepID=D8JWB3_HYPDA|nr:hypothetical protein [Hyphomicrobium denitrificans]ADJ23026.1 hypothetical protein Hden_1214 [Hyphomicrobium denitrificans ATCC 51888]